MGDFKERFGEDMGNGEYGFSNVRNGLIVGLVCVTFTSLFLDQGSLSLT